MTTDRFPVKIEGWGRFRQVEVREKEVALEVGRADCIHCSICQGRVEHIEQALAQGNREFHVERRRDGAFWVIPSAEGQSPVNLLEEAMDLRMQPIIRREGTEWDGRVDGSCLLVAPGIFSDRAYSLEFAGNLVLVNGPNDSFGAHHPLPDYLILYLDEAFILNKNEETLSLLTALSAREDGAVCVVILTPIDEQGLSQRLLMATGLSGGVVGYLPGRRQQALEALIEDFLARGRLG